MSDGATFEGQFKDNRPKRGKLSFANGFELTGSFNKKLELKGEGKVKSPSGLLLDTKFYKKRIAADSGLAAKLSIPGLEPINLKLNYRKLEALDKDTELSDNITITKGAELDLPGFAENPYAFLAKPQVLLKKANINVGIHEKPAMSVALGVRDGKLKSSAILRIAGEAPMTIQLPQSYRALVIDLMDASKLKALANELKSNIKIEQTVEAKLKEEPKAKKKTKPKTRKTKSLEKMPIASFPSGTKYGNGFNVEKLLAGLLGTASDASETGSGPPKGAISRLQAYASRWSGNIKTKLDNVPDAQLAGELNGLRGYFRGKQKAFMSPEFEQNFIDNNIKFRKERNVYPRKGLKHTTDKSGLVTTQGYILFCPVEQMAKYECHKDKELVKKYRDYVIDGAVISNDYQGLVSIAQYTSMDKNGPNLALYTVDDQSKLAGSFIHYNYDDDLLLTMDYGEEDLDAKVYLPNNKIIDVSEILYGGQQTNLYIDSNASFARESGKHRLYVRLNGDYEDFFVIDKNDPCYTVQIETELDYRNYVAIRSVKYRKLKDWDSERALIDQLNRIESIT